ncbi:MAG: hypothetical protein LBH19_01830 [Dysgonamonadaceae bacterium]|jgi:hypothetical protein|nr:hypothetical protein [Dysgonamonadaceae bacterium]
MKKIFLSVLLLFVYFNGLQAQQMVTGGNQISVSERPWQVVLKRGCDINISSLSTGQYAIAITYNGSTYFLGFYKN